MKDLILVESPTKARTLNSFLQGAYDIEASMGHVLDLPKSKMGVDIEKHFKPEYVIADEKKGVLKKLLTKAKKANSIILATDPDREGEAISHHLYELLKDEVGAKKLFRRIVFHEITKEAIDKALEHARDIDMNLVSAQTARRVLDRIVGYNLSPILWKKVRRNLSAGRVQSVALRLIVEREREIEKFKKEGYARIFVSLVGEKKKVVEFELIQINNDKVEITTKIELYDGQYTYAKTILDLKKADIILDELKTLSYTVTDVQKKDTRRSPYPPFITSSLQQDAARRLFFPSKKTMNLAQKLYEEGFITYHRTDSYNLSQQFITRARSFIEKEFGKKYISEAPRVFKTKSKVAQEAHEAIRPTKVERLDVMEQEVVSILGRDAGRLFELIYKRALATQMADAFFESTTVLVEGKGKDTYLFKVNGSILRFDGFLKLWYVEESDNLLPAFTVGEKLGYVDGKTTEHETLAPPRYNEASLIGTLEKNGIGRPSTYASIVSTISERGYVERIENRFVPTPVGISVNDFLVKNFSDIDDIPFTAEMEDKLDAIANGELKYVPMMEEFYDPFQKQLEKAEDANRVEVPTEKTDKKCPKCKADVVIRTSRFGKFLSCSRFPDCDYKASYAQETDFTCPKDGGKVVSKKTRKGRIFYGCSNYPKCDFAVWKMSDLKKN